MARKTDRDGTGGDRFLRGIGLALSLEVNLCLNRETDQGDNRERLPRITVERHLRCSLLRRSIHQRADFRVALLRLPPPLASGGPAAFTEGATFQRTEKA